MAGVKDFMNRRYPRVPRQWECEKYDLPCLFLAQKQEERQFLVLQQKTNMLRRRYGQCVRIHENNRNMFCREELVRYQDSYNRLQSTGLAGYMGNSYPNENGPLRSARGSVRPDQFYMKDGDTHHHMAPPPKTEQVRQRPAIIYAEDDGVMPDPDRPIVVFNVKERDAVNITIHLPDTPPPAGVQIGEDAAAASGLV